MLSLKNSTVGIDIPIQEFQSFLYRQLKVLWPVDDNTMDGFGRVYRNRNNKGYVPELFVSSTSDNNTVYEPVYFDKNTKKALFFFDPDDQETIKGPLAIRNVSIVFIVNISLLKTTLAHRGDEEVRNEVLRTVSPRRNGFELIGVETGFKNVFSRFDGLTNKDGEVFEDRHPVHCFKINMRLNYSINKVC